jgi:hypothetical protein
MKITQLVMWAFQLAPIGLMPLVGCASFEKQEINPTGHIPKTKLTAQCSITLFRNQAQLSEGRVAVYVTANAVVKFVNSHGKSVRTPLNAEGSASDVGFINIKSGKLTELNEGKISFKACEAALITVALKFDHVFPTTGTIFRVNNHLPKSLELDRGSNQGILPDQKMVVWMDDGGVAVPIAHATAAPAMNTSTLTVAEWTNMPWIDGLRKQIFDGKFKVSAISLSATTLGRSPHFLNQFGKFQPRIPTKPQPEKPGQSPSGEPTNESIPAESTATIYRTGSTGMKIKLPYNFNSATSSHTLTIAVLPIITSRDKFPEGSKNRLASCLVQKLREAGFTAHLVNGKPKGKNDELSPINQDKK